MNHKISDDRTTLTISADLAERESLHELGDEIHQDAIMHNVFEPLICNSELEWIDPKSTGDLTSAPMLGILGKTKNADHVPFPCLNMGHWDGRDWACKIASRWAFMDYQVRSVLEDLRDNGEVIFVGGDL